MEFARKTFLHYSPKLAPTCGQNTQNFMRNLYKKPIKTDFDSTILFVNLKLSQSKLYRPANDNNELRQSVDLL